MRSYGGVKMWIDNASQVDILFYEPYADVIAGIAQNPDYKPLTIGVFGLWGAGKSTLLNLIEQKIPSDSKKTICVKINAWTFEGYEDSKVAIIECLLRELKEKAPEGIGKRILGLLKKVDFFKLGTKVVSLGAPIVASLATGNPLPLLFSFNGTASEIENGIKNASTAFQNLRDEYIKDDSSQSDDSLVNNIRKFREEFESTLNESEIENVIVLIDDLDRCQPERIIETLEAIKLFLSVNKTTFIISVDENIIQYAIKKKYPALDGFSVSFDREYIEKIIQLPIYIPELSSKDIENYMMLLVAQQYCDSKGFLELIGKLRAEKTRISEAKLTVEKMKELCGSLIKSEEQKPFLETLQIVDGIRGLISGNLKGNPRQAKRFLNTFTTKRQLAGLYYGENAIDYRILAKLLVLQKLDPTLFIELNEWNKSFSTINEKYKLMKDTISKEDAANLNDGYSSWRVPAIKKWVLSNPVDLELIPLDRYFYLTRENLKKTEVDNSTISMASKDVLAKLANSSLSSIQSPIAEMKKLTPGEIEDVIKIVLLQFQQDKINLFILAAILESFDSYGDQIIDSLHEYKGKITLKDIPQLIKMKKTSKDKTEKLISVWIENGVIPKEMAKKLGR